MPHKRLSLPALPRLLRRILIGLAIFLLTYAVIGFLALPALIRYQGPKLINDKLHRPASIGKVDINPFTLSLAIHDFRIMEPDGQAVFVSYDTLALDLSRHSLLKLAPVVERIHLTGPYVHVARLDAQRTSVDDLIALIDSQPPSDKPARFSVNNIQVEGGRIELDDRPARAKHTISDVRLGIPFISSLPADVAIYVEPLLSASVNGTPLRIAGKARPFADPRDAIVDLHVDDLDLTRFLAYLPLARGVSVPSARLNSQLALSFRQEKDKAPALLLNGVVTLKDLRILDGGKPAVQLPELTATVKELNVLATRYAVDRLTVTGLDANVTRLPDGTLNLQQLFSSGKRSAAPAKTSGFAMSLREAVIRNAHVRYADQAPARPMQAELADFSLTLRQLAVDTARKSVSVGDLLSEKATIALRQGARQDGAPAGAAERSAAPEAANSDGYAIQLGKVAADNWTVRFEDQAAPEPVTLEASALAFSLSGYSSAAPAPAQVRLAARINGKGRMEAQGSLGLAPLAADLSLRLDQIDLLPLQPYFTEHLSVRLSRAALSSQGQVKIALGKDGKLEGAYRGNARLGNFATVEAANASEFLRWNALDVNGADIRFAPLSVSIDEVRLADFFARVIIDANGRINLQDILKAQKDERKARAGASPAAVPAARTSAQSETAAAASRTAMPPIVIRKLLLESGRVRFTDNFIRPNYSASLMNFGGTVSSLSSDPASTAAVALQGVVNGAPLSIAGRVNPLRRDLFLDLKANVRGMELASLSPYSNRYIGYGIEKGKLSFEVAYQLENRKLTAQNRLILDQLTLGAPSDSPLAVKLPVHLALALLRDNNGVIDIEVPIGGSLDDPQFSVGGIILKVFANAIAKAVTQPFTFLASVFGGGGEQLASMPFPAGAADIPPDGEKRLQTLARALAERPALNLEITGRADAQTDLDGLRRAAVERKVRSLKLRDLRARGESPERGRVIVSPAEYPELLRRVYQAETFDKPKNVLGLPKSLPVSEMEKLLADNAQIDEDDLTTLANRRSQAVKDWLIAEGKVPAERLFILAGRSGNDGKDGKSPSPARVDFSLR